MVYVDEDLLGHERHVDWAGVDEALYAFLQSYNQSRNHTSEKHTGVFYMTISWALIVFIFCLVVFLYQRKTRKNTQALERELLLRL